jgi:Rrf2 family protein
VGAGGEPVGECDLSQPGSPARQQDFARQVGAEVAPPGRDEPDVLPPGGVGAPGLSKQLQALVRAGVLTAGTGLRGGFRLARPADQITLLQVVEAVDGGSPFYTCNEIRQRGRGAVPPEECRKACSLAGRMAEAEAAWCESLAAVTIADIVAGLPSGVPGRTRALLARPR